MIRKRLTVRVLCYILLKEQKSQHEQNRKKLMEEKIMHLLITEDDMALAQGLQRITGEKPAGAML